MNRKWFIHCEIDNNRYVTCKSIKIQSSAAIAVNTGHMHPEERPNDVGRGGPSVSCMGKVTRCEALQRCVVRGNSATIREETGAFNSLSNVHLAFFNRPLLCACMRACACVCVCRLPE